MAGLAELTSLIGMYIFFKKPCNAPVLKSDEVFKTYVVESILHRILVVASLCVGKGAAKRAIFVESAQLWATATPVFTTFTLSMQGITGAKSMTRIF